MPPIHISHPRLLASACCFAGFGIVWTWFWFSNRKAAYIYFDAQDFAKYQGGGGRKLPISAEKGTFAPFLGHYIDVTKLLVTVAAASIAFGANQNTTDGILIAKNVLAFSILYGILFCASLLYIYDEYGQNLEVYSKFWYSTVEALGVSALLSFVGGFFVWALNLG